MNSKKGVNSDIDKFMAFQMKHLFGERRSQQVELEQEEESYE